VWGGDWNQNLAEGWQHVGCQDGRNLLNTAIEALDLQVPSAGLLHQLGPGHHTIDHIAVPSGWQVKGAVSIVATGRSEDDAYVVEVQDK
jgi:hypothetical protein